jgi:hypothetical protein
MLWAAHPDACGGSGGIRSLFANGREAWKAILARIGPSQNGGKSPDVIVFNTGLHDMQLGFQLNQFLEMLRTALADLQALSQRVVWKRCGLGVMDFRVKFLIFW